MVLNKSTPYSSDDEDSRGLDPWEFVESEVQAVPSETEARSSTTAAIREDGSSRTPNITDEACVGGRNEDTMQTDANDDDEKDNLVEKNVGLGISLDIDNEVSSNRKENSNSNEYAHDEANENNTDPNLEDTSNQHNFNQESTPLNTQEDSTTTNVRPRSPEQHLPLPLHQTWNFITSSLQEIDRQNQIRQRTQNGVKKINTSLQNLWTNVTIKTERLGDTLQTHCDQADIQARETSLHIQRSLSSTKDNLCRINSEYRIHEKIAAVAAVGGAILVASGNPRAGASSLLVAGGALAAGEVMSATSERGSSTFTRDYGLREGVHLD